MNEHELQAHGSRSGTLGRTGGLGGKAACAGTTAPGGVRGNWRWRGKRQVLHEVTVLLFTLWQEMHVHGGGGTSARSDVNAVKPVGVPVPAPVGTRMGAGRRERDV